MGALEFNVRDDGGLELAKSKLFIGVSVACEYESQFFIAWIPVNMKVGFSLGVGAEASLHITTRTTPMALTTWI